MTNENSVTRIIIIDDHRLFRSGLKSLLTPFEDLRVVAEAATAAEGLEAVTRHACDVVLLDFNLPDEEGPYLAARIRRRFPELPILLLSQHDDPVRVRQAMEAGCHGYLVKDSDEQHLVIAVRLVAEGGMYVHPRVARAVVGGSGRVRGVGPRELEILSMLASGRSNQEIARSLNVSLGTIKRDLSTLYDQFGVSDRTRLVAEAMSRGLVKPLMRGGKPSTRNPAGPDDDQPASGAEHAADTGNKA